MEAHWVVIIVLKRSKAVVEFFLSSSNEKQHLFCSQTSGFGWKAPEVPVVQTPARARALVSTIDSQAFVYVPEGRHDRKTEFARSGWTGERPRLLQHRHSHAQPALVQCTNIDMNA